MIFSDSHCHIYGEQFDQDIVQIIRSAKDSNVERFFLPNIDSSYHERMNSLCRKFPEELYPMMGVHPCSINENWERELEIARRELFEDKSLNYCAVGEIGLDLYWDKTFLKEQQKAFSTQVSWAKELNLPIVIHVRDAFQEIFDLMDDLYDDNLRGIFHCFTGGMDEMNHILNYSNFMFGIGGVVTFKNSKLHEVVSQIPNDKLVLETDSPYLAPHPNRGKRNEPSYLLYIAKRVAAAKNIDLEELSILTENNVNKMFAL